MVLLLHKKRHRTTVADDIEQLMLCLQSLVVELIKQSAESGFKMSGLLEVEGLGFMLKI